MFIPNPRFVEELKKDPDFIEGLKERAEAAVGPAERLAHRMVPRRGSRQIEVREEDGQVLLVNTNWSGLFEEIGSKKTPVYAPLRRGATAAGFRLQEPES